MSAPEDVHSCEFCKVGRVVQIQGREIHRARAHIIVGLWGSPGRDAETPWMDGLMQFVQVDGNGRPEPLDDRPEYEPIALDPPWSRLRDRARALQRIRP